MEVSEIIKRAVELGACSKSQKATDWKSLAWLFFSPQGREFCKKHNYPSTEVFRQMKGNVEQYGVHIEDNIEAQNKDIAIIGSSESILYYSGVNRPYWVILMHGASVTIHASEYAVVKVENISGEYKVYNDGTATVI